MISHQDYCNSLLAGLPASATKPLQHITEHCSAPRFQSTQIWPPPLWPPLASCCGPHTIQDDGAGLQGHQWNCTCLPPNTGQTTRTRESTSLSWLAGTAIAESKQSPLSKAVTLLSSGASVVDQSWTAESLFIFCKQLKIHLFRLQTWPRIAWLPPPKKKKKKICTCTFVSLAL